MDIKKRLTKLEQRQQIQQQPMEPIVIQVQDCSENPETFQIIGLNAGKPDDNPLDRLPAESIEAMSDRWMDTYYTPELKERRVVPILWCTYSRDPVSASDVKVTNAKVMQ